MKKTVALFLSIIFIMQTAPSVFASKRVVKEDENAELSSSFVSVVPNGDDVKKLPVEVKAKSAVLMDVSTGKILMTFNPDIKLFPASVTKIMTVLLVAEALNEKKINLTDKVACSLNAAGKGGSQIWLEEGEEMTVDELLRATVIGSANDAATLLGEYVSGSEEAFISLMNKRAKELGMNNTHFVNATGLDDTTDEHLTTARDIAVMSCELLKYDFITDYTTVWMDSLRNGKTELVNTNRLVRFFDGTTGLKTGTTAKAGCCVSASAKRGDLHLVAVVLGSTNSNDRFETAKAMLNWGFSNYASYTPKVDGSLVKSVKVIGGRSDSVGVLMPRISPLIIKKGEEDKVRVDVELCDDVEAPVCKNQTLGTVKITVSEKGVSEYKLTASNEVEKLNIIDAMLKIFNFVSNGNTDYPYPIA